MSLDEQLAGDEEGFDAETVEENLEEVAEDSGDFGDWGGEELEAAYLKAMSALEASDLELPPVQPVSAQSVDGEVELSDGIVANSASESLTSDPPAAPSEDQAALIAEMFAQANPAPVIDPNVLNITAAEARVTPRQIIEACLFVGGTALTSKRLSGVLRGEFDGDFVDREIDALNRQYAAENRPYEIRLVEGGYRMALREEFERIRHKAYGLGPKEVRLSQEALEVLAVVAYHQPIKQSRVEELGKSGCGPVLRQLVRRELLAVERDPEHPRDVDYKTTPRFLSLFGLRSLDELPRHEQVSYK